MGKIILNGTSYAGSGGGGGGHTIVDPTGTDMPQENKLQFTGAVNVSDDSANGQTVVDIEGGGGNVYGAFINTNDVIVNGTSFLGSLTYTAPKDCYVGIYFITSSALVPMVKIDGKIISQAYYNGNLGTPFGVYLKQGQVLTVEDSNPNSSGTYWVYGLTQGTESIFAPVIYSDTERVIGVWRDNKPLYQKTFVQHSTDVSGTGVLVDVSTLNIDTCVNLQGICDRNVPNVGTLIYEFNSYEDSGLRTYLAYSKFNNNVQFSIRFYNGESTSVQYITIQYTKTTDTAGSGNWNTDGVPTHHYSTNEQVIGTWIDGKPRYEITLSGSGSYSAGTELVVPLPTNADKVVIMGGYVDIGTDWLPLALTLGVGTGITNGVYCYPNKSTGIHIYSSAWTFSEYNVTVQYCKTTD